jgi:hypothetical protein
MFGEWYYKTNKTEDTNKLILLAFKIIAIVLNKVLGTFIPFLETVSKSLFINRLQNRGQLPTGATSGAAGTTSEEKGGLLFVSSPEEHRGRHTICRRGGNPRTCDSGSAIDS